MLGDVLLITEKHQKAGEKITEYILANLKPKMMIGISGESGSGKSELAHVIAKGMRKHGIFAKPLHIDNYYRILPLMRTEWRKENGIQKVVGYSEYDWDTINRNIAEFKAGEISTGPCVDLVTEQVVQLLICWL
jgi:uridine kinase